MSHPARCRPRFKGIETFLRRIAFNLGNTASQTEVKIISCIPIDVTDLQNRICELERELESYSVRCESANVKHVCHTALVSVPPPVFEPPRPYDCAADDTRALRELLQPDTQDVVPRHSSSTSVQSAPVKERTLEAINDNEPSETKQHPTTRHVDKEKTPKDKEKEKKLKKKRKYNQSQLVYYTHTDTKSPFDHPNPINKNDTQFGNRNDSESINDVSEYTSKKREMNEGYISNMVRRQYEHYPIGPELSDASEFSTPICRDLTTNDGRELESDICSCCHGAFHNVDDTMRLAPHAILWDATPVHRIDHYQPQHVTNNVFYDSSLYDIVPVREKPQKQRRDENIYIDQDQKRYLKSDICIAKSKRTKQRKLLNYHNVAPLRVNPRFYANRKKVHAKATIQKRESLSRLAHPRKSNWKRRLDKSRTPDTSAIDFSPIYTRPICTTNVPNNCLTKTKAPVEVKNVECLTTSVNNSECQTASTKSVQIEPIVSFDENKTEVTLNQIKTILQSVLTEVKTSAMVKNTPERAPKKDAVVQKDQSQNNIANMQTTAAATTSSVQPMHTAVSSFMNSYSYSPYSLTPYGPSCSRQMPSSTVPPPVSPFQPKCMHNYPLFIQTTGRQCACCFRTMPKNVNATGSAIVSPTLPPPPPPSPCRPPPATIATNTDQHVGRDLQTPTRSKETDKLIQEIYKSIAVNMDYFTKNSSSDYNELKSSSPSRKPTEIGLPSAQERKKQVAVAMVRRQSNLSSSKSEMTPPLVSKATLSTGLRASQKTPTSVTKQSSESVRRELTALRRRRGMLVRSSSSQSTSSTLTSNVSESEKTVTGVRFEDQKTEKPSLFKKMVNLFSGRRKSWRKEQADVSYSEESESDDYQTIYSYKTEKQQRRRAAAAGVHARYKKPHSKVSYSRPHKSKRSPYMEQEYRRDWNERLTFQPDKTIHSSEKPMSRGTSGGRRHRY